MMVSPGPRQSFSAVNACCVNDMMMHSQECRCEGWCCQCQLRKCSCRTDGQADVQVDSHASLLLVASTVYAYASNPNPGALYSACSICLRSVCSEAQLHCRPAGRVWNCGCKSWMCSWSARSGRMQRHGTTIPFIRQDRSCSLQPWSAICSQHSHMTGYTSLLVSSSVISIVQSCTKHVLLAKPCSLVSLDWLTMAT